MYDVNDLMILYALTSAHIGSDDDLNYIDLPIQREKHTGFPKIEASSLKGSIKQAMGQSEDVYEILGSEDSGEIASAVSFSDARLLFFPVKSAKGIFAYVTCPFVIKRFLSDCKIAGATDIGAIKSEWLLGSKAYVTSTESSIVFNREKVILDEYIFEVEKNDDFRSLVEIIEANLPLDYFLSKDLLSRSILISDDEFSYFVKNSTEVVTRIKINSDGTSEDKALFTQENLPPESILYSLLFFSNSKKHSDKSAKEVKKEFDDLFESDIIQVGGDKTLGKGLFYKKIWGGGRNKR